MDGCTVNMLLFVFAPEGLFMASLPYGELKIPRRRSKEEAAIDRWLQRAKLQGVKMGPKAFGARRAPPGLFQRRLREAEEAKKKRTKPPVETGFTPPVIKKRKKWQPR